MTVSRSDCRINTTEPNQMILVSFLSEDNVLYDEIEICYIFDYQSKKNWAFRFFWDTRYMQLYAFSFEWSGWDGDQKNNAWPVTFLPVYTMNRLTEWL